MSESLSLLKRVLSYGTISMGTVMAMFLFHVIAGRYLGVVDYGRFSFALTISLILAPMLDPGVYYLIIREVARDPSAAPRYLSHALTWKLVCGPFFLLLVLVSAGLIHESEITLRAVALLAVAQILQSAKNAVRPTFLGLEKFGLDAFSLTLERFGLLIVCGLLLRYGGGLMSVCWAFVIVRFVDFCIAVLLVSPTVNISIGVDFRFLRSMLRAALPIGAFYITINIYNYVDVVMLSSLRGDEEVGWYSAAYRLYEGTMIIPAVISTVFMPRLSRLYVENREHFVTTLRRGVEWVVGASAIVMVSGFSLAQWLVEVSFGSSYSNSMTALRVLVLGAVFAFSINFLQTVLISIDRQRIVLIVAFTGLVGNIALNLFLIPVYGFIGASVATVVVEIFVCAILVRFAWKVIRSKTFVVPDELS